MRFVALLTLTLSTLAYAQDPYDWWDETPEFLPDLIEEGYEITHYEVISDFQKKYLRRIFTLEGFTQTSSKSCFRRIRFSS